MLEHLTLDEIADRMSLARGWHDPLACPDGPSERQRNYAFLDARIIRDSETIREAVVTICRERGLSPYRFAASIVTAQVRGVVDFDNDDAKS